MDVNDILTPRDLAYYVAEYYGVNKYLVLGPHRHKLVADPRAIAMFLIRKKHGWSYPDIGQVFHRDHSTVITAIRKVNAMVIADGYACQRILDLETALGIKTGLVEFAVDKKKVTPAKKLVPQQAGSFGLD